MTHMTQAELHDKYDDKKPIGVYCMSNWGGLEILDIEHGIDDYIICRWNFGTPETRIHRVKASYNAEDCTFKVGEVVIKMSDCMRA